LKFLESLVLELTIAVAWVILRALFTPFRVLRLWLADMLSFEAALLLIFKIFANLVSMLKGLREYKNSIK